MNIQWNDVKINICIDIYIHLSHVYLPKFGDENELLTLTTSCVALKSLKSCVEQTHELIHNAYIKVIKEA